jgi:hypothetical protein
MVSPSENFWDGRTLPRADSHSFIVKVWLEQSLEEAEKATWRGSITHVGTRRSAYFQTLDAVASFVAPYLTAMGVEFGLGARIKRRLDRWLPRL